MTSQIKFSWVPLISWPHATQCSGWTGIQWTLPTGGSGGGICVVWAVALHSGSLCVWGCVWVVYTCAYMLWNRHWSWKGMGRVLAWATAVSVAIVLIAPVVVSSACVRRSIFPYPFHLALFSVLWVAVISPNVYCVWGNWFDSAPTCFLVCTCAASQHVLMCAKDLLWCPINLLLVNSSQ